MLSSQHIQGTTCNKCCRVYLFCVCMICNTKQKGKQTKRLKYKNAKIVLHFCNIFFSCTFCQKDKINPKEATETLPSSSHKSHRETDSLYQNCVEQDSPYQNSAEQIEASSGEMEAPLIKGAHQPLLFRPLQRMELFFSNWRLHSVHWEEAVHIDFSATIIARSLICGPLLCTPSVVVWAGGVGRSGEVFARAGGTWDPFSQPLSFPGLAMELL